MILRAATAPDGSKLDLRLGNGVIEQIGPPDSLEAGTAGEIDLTGYLLMGALAEPHAHLDKAFTAEELGTPPDLPGAISVWHTHRAGLDPADIEARARRGALESLAYGVTAIRSHVDVGAGIALRGVEALLSVRDELADLIDIQVAAMTYPVAGEAGRDNLELLRKAVAMGVDLIGGAPHVCPDPPAEIQTLSALADASGLPMDLHMDEHLRASLDLRDLLDVVEGGFDNAVTASHCVSLGMQNVDDQDAVARRVAACGMGIVTCPVTNLNLQAREIRVAMPRGLTAVDALVSAGALLAAGGDNVQDPFNPVGCGDPLQTAHYMVTAGHLDVDRAFDLVAGQARRVMGLESIPLEPGSDGDLVAIRAASGRQALATLTPARLVFRRGELVARTELKGGLTGPAECLPDVGGEA